MAATQSNTILKLNGGNWSTWKFETRIILKGQGHYDIVTGERPKPKDFLKWVRNDATAQTLIVTRMEQGPQTHILSYEISDEMWSKLTGVYDKESAVSVHLLQQKFFTTEFTEGVSTFLFKIKDIRAKLKQAGE